MKSGFKQDLRDEVLVSWDFYSDNDNLITSIRLNENQVYEKSIKVDFLIEEDEELFGCELYNLHDSKRKTNCLQGVRFIKVKKSLFADC